MTKMARYVYEINEPTAAYIAERQATFAGDPQFFGVEAALERVFAAFPGNTSVEVVLAKAACLDRLYSTNVYAIVAMSQHIVALDVDHALREGRPEVVNDIAGLKLEGNNSWRFSFATKYCSFSAPNRYHIFDNQVRWLLLAYRKRFGFAEFAAADLYDYPKFAALMDAFAQHYGLATLTKKQIDKFLWIEASEVWRAAKTVTI